MKDKGIRSQHPFLKALTDCQWFMHSLRNCLYVSLLFFKLDRVTPSGKMSQVLWCGDSLIGIFGPYIRMSFDFTEVEITHTLQIAWTKSGLCLLSWSNFYLCPFPPPKMLFLEDELYNHPQATVISYEIYVCNPWEYLEYKVDWIWNIKELRDLDSNWSPDTNLM